MQKVAFFGRNGTDISACLKNRVSVVYKYIKLISKRYKFFFFTYVSIRGPSFS